MGSKKADQYYAQLMAQLGPALSQNKQFADFGLTAGKENIGAGTEGINALLEHFNKILYGSRDSVLENQDLSAITSDYDNAEKLTADFGVRGGRRAETLANIPFEKAASINRYYQMLKNAAPEQIANLNKLLADIGIGELGVGSNASGQNLTAIQNASTLSQQMAAADKDRRAQLLGSIFGAAGGALGAIFGGACVTLDTPVLVDGNYIKARNVGSHIDVVSRNGTVSFGEVIRTEVTKEQEIFKLKTEDGFEINCTDTHKFVLNFEPDYIEKELKDLKVGSLIIVLDDGLNYKIDRIASIEKQEEKEDVIIFKALNEKDENRIVTAGFVVLDDYPNRGK